MDEECFDTNFRANFGCLTEDLIVFECECIIYNAEREIVKNIQEQKSANQLLCWVKDSQKSNVTDCIPGRGEGDDVFSTQMKLKKMFQQCRDTNRLPLRCHSFKNGDQENRLVYCQCSSYNKNDDDLISVFKSKDFWAIPQSSFNATSLHEINSAHSHFAWSILLILFLIIIAIFGIRFYRNRKKNCFGNSDTLGSISF